jgi:hypothetical protein
VRDPNGYLIEVGQATGMLEGIFADLPATAQESTIRQVGADWLGASARGVKTLPGRRRLVGPKFTTEPGWLPARTLTWRDWRPP